MLNFLTALISPVTNLADKLILDKDKYAELQHKKLELKHKSKDKLLSITTTPKTDAFVKLLIAFNDVILPLLRPVGSACMTGFVIYCEANDIELSAATELMMAGAFPAWMASRHKNKSDEIKKSGRPSKEDWE